MSIQTAEQYEENEQYELALAEYEKVNEQKPNNIEVLERLGHLSSILNKKDDAVKYYSKILEQDPQNLMVYEQLCDLYYTTDKYKYYTYRGNMKNLEKQYDYAMNDYRKAINHTDKEEEIIVCRFAIGALAEVQGNDNKAIDEYLKIIDHDKLNEAAYLKLANIYLRQNILSAGISTLEQGIKNGITNKAIMEILAELYLKNGDAQKAFETTENDLMKAKCLLEMNKLQEAKDLVSKIEDNYKNTAQIYILKAQIEFIEKNWDKAFDYIEKYNELEKNSPLYFQMRALIFEAKGDEFNELVSWAKYHLLRKDTDIAINEFLQAHKINSDDKEVISSLATLLEANNDKNHAMEFYEKLSILDPSDKSALLKLADFRESIGDYGSQYDYLEKLLKIDSRNVEALKNMGKCCEKMKNYPSAVEYYTDFLKYNRDLNENTYIQDKINKYSGMSNEQASTAGWLDKIMQFFNKDS